MTESIDPVFGWRYFTFDRCVEHDTFALVGGNGGVLHRSLAPEAICLRFRNNSLNWCMDNQPVVPIDAASNHEVPSLECTCGYYLLWKPDPSMYPDRIAAWCQAIGTTILAENGLRTAQFRLHVCFLPHPSADSPSLSKTPRSLSDMYGLELHEFLKVIKVRLASSDAAEATEVFTQFNIPSTTTELYGTGSSKFSST